MKVTIKKTTLKMTITGENKVEKEEYFYFENTEDADKWLENYRWNNYKINEKFTVTVDH